MTAHKMAAVMSESPLWTPVQLAAYLGGDFSEKTLANYRSAGRGPRFIKLEGGRVRYDRADVHAWLDAQRKLSS